jgi:hypothetical protein
VLFRFVLKGQLFFFFVCQVSFVITHDSEPIAALANKSGPVLDVADLVPPGKKIAALIRRSDGGYRLLIEPAATSSISTRPGCHIK